MKVHYTCEREGGPGMVPLDRFVAARLADDERTAPADRASAELAAKRRVLEAYGRSK